MTPYRLLACSLAMLFIAGVAPSAALPAAQAGSALDRVIAIVNDDVITATQLAARIRETRRQLTAEGIRLPPEDVLRRQLLERMILERLQLQLAARAGLRISDADIDRAIGVIAQRNKQSVAEFQRLLQREGPDSAAHRAQVRDLLLIEQLVDREVRNRVVVTDSEVEAFLENQESQASLNTEYNLSHIFLAVPESASPAAIQAARQRAEEIHAKLRDGADFEQTALAYSQGAESLKGGSLGWKKAGQLPELFLGALRDMKPGAVSEVLKSPNGFHILRLHERRGGAAAEDVQQTRARHILIRPSEVLSLADARQKLLQLRARIEHGEDFAALARASSEDTASASRGGDLGWVTPGTLVPEFERAMNALKPGELSEPVQSAFGLHLIQVLERRQQDVSAERLRAAARGQIGARKADERYQQWVRQLRDEAFVEYLGED